MKQQTTPAIILRRTNYGEADRIVTFLTPIGKIRAIVKGVRRSKSKLAGGIELFSESTITFLDTRGSLARIISTRLETHWDPIVGDLQRMMFGYETMKMLDIIVEDEAGREYFDLLRATLDALADLELPLTALEIWFFMRLLKLQGKEPNLATDSSGVVLKPDNLYTFSTESMSFSNSAVGTFTPDHVKLLRLTQSHAPKLLKQVKNVQVISEQLKPLIQQLNTL